MGEVDHEEHAVDHRVADGEERVDRAQSQPEHDLLRQDRKDLPDVHLLRTERRRLEGGRDSRRPDGRPYLDHTISRTRGARARSYLTFS